MINLLPPEVKTEIRFARRNAVMRSYLVLAICVGVLLVGTLAAGRYYLNTQITTATRDLADKQQLEKKYTSTQTQTSALNARLSAIQTIQHGQSNFSVLLSDLAQYMPRGTAISSITLSGDDKKPVQLTVTAVDYKTALGFRDSIVSSKRISAADIQSIKADPAKTTYTVVVLFAFNAGAAR